MTRAVAGNKVIGKLVNQKGKNLLMSDIKEQLRQYICYEVERTDTLLSERELAQKFCTKRGNAREVLLSLESEGLLLRHPQRGYSFVEYGSASYGRFRFLRYIVELTALRCAIDQATKEDIERVYEILQRGEQILAENRLADFSNADLEFHDALILASHDKMLIHVFSFLKIALFHPEQLAQRPLSVHLSTLKSHRAIYAAFKERDWASLSQVFKQHLGNEPVLYAMREDI